MAEYNVTNGVTSTGITLYDESMYVSNGGTADKTTLNEKGDLYVSSGGKATNTTVNEDGYIFVSNGGSADKTTLNENGDLCVYSGGTATNTTVNDGGELWVKSGGKADKTTLNEGGKLIVWSGGTASDTTVNKGGRLYVNEGGKIKGSTTVNQGGTASFEGGNYNAGIAVHGGRLALFSSKTEDNSGDSCFFSKITMDSGGTLFVSNGASACSATISNGKAYVSSGGILDSATLTSTYIRVANGATVSRIDLKEGSVMDVWAGGEGGKLQNVRVSSGAVLYSDLRNASELRFYGGTLGLYIADRGPGNDYLIDETSFSSIQGTYFCTLTIYYATQANGTYKLIENAAGFDKTITVKDLIDGASFRTLTVGEAKRIGDTTYTLSLDASNDLILTIAAAGGKTPDLTGELTSNFRLTDGMYANNAGILTNNIGLSVSSGGSADRTIVSSGWLSVFEGGRAEGSYIGYYGKCYVYSGGVADDTAVAGVMEVSRGGTADHVFVSSGAEVRIYVGGTATNIEWTPCEGRIMAFDQANFTFASSYAGVYYGSDNKLLSRAAAMDGMGISSNCAMNVMNGGTATGTTVNDVGGLYVWSGGVATGTTVDLNGLFYVWSGGAADNIVVNSGGFVDICGGSAKNATVNSRGRLYVQIGGVMTGAVISSRGELDVTYGASADHLIVEKGGLLYVSSGGTATNVEWTPCEGNLYVYSGATVTYASSIAGVYFGSDGKLLSQSLAMTGKLVGSKCQMKVLVNGTATNATVVSSGELNVSSGGTADIVTVGPGGNLYVSYGGTATQIVENGGYVYVDSGGSAEFLPNTISDLVLEDSFTAHSGTTAVNITLNKCNGAVYSGGFVSGATVYGDGIVGRPFFIYEGGVADQTTLEYGGDLYVYSGGVASNTLDKYYMGVDYGGVAVNATVTADGSLYVYEEGKVTGKLTFETGAKVIASAGAILDFDLTQTAPGAAALVNDLSFVLAQPFTYTLTVDGTESVGAYELAGGAAGFDKTITVVNTSGDTLGTLTIADGQTTIGDRKYTLTLDGSGNLSVTVAPAIDLTGDLTTSFTLGNDMVGSSVNILKGGVLNIKDGGFAGQTAVSSGGDLNVSQGGSADVVTVNFGGDLYVENGGKATQVVENGGYVEMEDGANVEFVANSFGGYAYNKPADWATLHSGTTGTDLTAGNGGAIQVYNGGLASRITVNSGGEIYVENVGSADVVSVNSGGSLYVSAGGKATQIVENGGRVVIVDTAVAEFVKNTFDGSAYNSFEDWGTLHSGTTGTNLTAGNDGGFAVYSGGLVQNATVGANGNLRVFEGGKVTGKITFEADAHVAADTGAILDFDLTQTAAGADALVNDLSFAMDTDFSYRLTVSGSEAVGDYKLAEGAVGFDRTITVVNTTGYELGTLTVADGKTTLGGRDYTLTLNGDLLSVTVAESFVPDTTPPVVSDVKASTTAPTNQNVTVTAVFSDNFALASSEYKIGDGDEWLAYPDAGVVVTANNTVYFKATDTSGLESEVVSCTVKNIDKVKPVVTNMQASTNKPTNQDVIVTAEFTDDVGVVSRLYMLNNGGGGWQAYPDGGVVVTENNTVVHFKAVDAAGNESEINSYKVANIDKEPPTITVNPSTTESGAESVTLSAVCKDETSMSSILQYRIGDGAWQDCTAGVVVTENTTVSFKTYDTAGNETIESYAVTNIETVVPDTTKPVVSNVKANITAATNKNVTVTAEFTDDVALASKLYRIGNGAWQNYVDGVTMTENATVYFKAVDTSDNESDVVSIAISNIDKAAPEKPVVTANVTKPTNGSVNVTATFADDSVKNEYSMDGVNWAQYPGVVKFDDNGTVYFRGTDAVGNVSEVASYEVKNIDKVAPAKPTASADITTTTGDNVTVTAVFSGDSAKKEFSLDGLVWQAYTAPLVFSENGRAYFRGTDAAGNASDIISYEVRNIQPATPDNAPDDGKNDTLYHKKTKEWASEENIASFVVNNITAGDSEVRLDKAGSVDDGKGRHNFVGRAGGDEDAADYAKIQLSKGAALSFSVDSTVAGTFYVYQATTNKKGDLVPAQRQKIAVKAGQTSPKKTATIYLEAGEYFIGMEAKLPTAKKNPEVGAYYSVNLAGTTFFNDADSGWNNTAYLLDDAGKEVKTRLNPELTGSALAFGRGVTSVKLDTGATGRDGYDNWGGFSDAADYRMLTLENDANVTLSLTATGKTKLTIWKVSTNAKTGVISLSNKGSTTAKADKAGTIKAKFLEAGTYFVSVESTDAKKGGSAYYNVTVDSDASVFFDSADDGRNDEMYDKKAKAFYGEDGTHHFETTNVSGAGINVKLDTAPVKADGYRNFVGCGDKTDFAKINLTTDGSLYFKIKTTGEATFTVYRKGQDKKDNDTLETIQTTKLKFDKGASVIDKFTGVISGLAAGEYYISMAATNTSTNAKGSVFYNVTATLEPSDMASLAMPETDTLDMTDALNFASLNTDALADISAASLADLNDKSAWQNLALA